MNQNKSEDILVYEGITVNKRHRRYSLCLILLTFLWNYDIIFL